MVACCLFDWWLYKRNVRKKGKEFRFDINNFKISFVNDTKVNSQVTRNRKQLQVRVTIFWFSLSFFFPTTQNRKILSLEKTNFVRLATANAATGPVIAPIAFDPTRMVILSHGDRYRPIINIHNTLWFRFSLCLEYRWFERRLISRTTSTLTCSTTRYRKRTNQTTPTHRCLSILQSIYQLSVIISSFDSFCCCVWKILCDWRHYWHWCILTSKFLSWFYWIIF